jgi:hypothetical protein
MSKFTDLLINSLAPAISAIAATKLTELFEKLHEHDPEGHAATLKSLYIGAGQLQRLTDDTKTKLDDAVVDALISAIEDSAKEYDVELPA